MATDDTLRGGDITVLEDARHTVNVCRDTGTLSTRSAAHLAKLGTVQLARFVRGSGASWSMCHTNTCSVQARVCIHLARDTWTLKRLCHCVRSDIFLVRNVVFLFVKSFSGPPEPGSR